MRTRRKCKELTTDTSEGLAGEKVRSLLTDLSGGFGNENHPQNHSGDLDRILNAGRPSKMTKKRENGSKADTKNIVIIKNQPTPKK